MNKFVLLSTIAAFALSAGVASAAVVTNSDKSDVTFSTNIGGKVESVTLKENGVYDSKGKDVGITIGSEKPVLAKAGESFVIKAGKLEAMPKTVSTDVKTETAPVTLSAEPAKLEPAAKAAAAPATVAK